MRNSPQQQGYTPTPAPNPQPGWTMFRHDPRHTGYSDSSAPMTNQTLMTYRLAFRQTRHLCSSFAIDKGVIFISSSERNDSSGGWVGFNLYALNVTNGELIWAYENGGGEVSPVPYETGKSGGGEVSAVADGLVILVFHIQSCSMYSTTYTCESTTFVCALNETTGMLIWRYKTKGWYWIGSTVVDGAVYVSSGGDKRTYKIYALNQTNGELIWSQTLKFDLATPPAVADGMVFVGSADNKVYALNQDTGAEIWVYDTGFHGPYTNPVITEGPCGLTHYYSSPWRMVSTPAVVGGAVFVGADKVYALNQTNGMLIWSYNTTDVGNSPPAVADGVVFINSCDGKVYALNQSTGNLVWSCRIDRDITWSDKSKNIYVLGIASARAPSVAGGVVFVTSSNKIYALNQTNGMLIWSYDCGTDWLGSQSNLYGVAVAGGVAFVASLEAGYVNGYADYYNGKIYAFGPHAPYAHDVAVTNVTATPTTVTAGESVSIKVVVTNEGSETETFNVTVYSNNILIGTQTVANLAPGASKALTFTWDTTGCYCYHCVKAVASAVPGEIDTGDNTRTYGWVKVN